MLNDLWFALLVRLRKQLVKEELRGNPPASLADETGVVADS
jgi:hypothetical protein